MNQLNASLIVSQRVKSVLNHMLRVAGLKLAWCRISGAEIKTLLQRISPSAANQ